MASHGKDMRRPDLAVPYIEHASSKSEADISGASTSTLPMAAIFTRNKLIGWTAVAVAIQSWLSETPDSRKASGTPAILSIGLALMSLFVSYLALFTPPSGQASNVPLMPASL